MTNIKPGEWDMLRDITAITLWLDRSNPDNQHEDSCRVMKIGEEYGEAVAAYIGMTGQNPRKGITHSQADLLMELADVAITAMCAMSHFIGNNPDIVRAFLASKISGIMSRSNIAPYPEGPECEPLFPEPPAARLAAMHGANWHVVTREPTIGEEIG